MTFPDSASLHPDTVSGASPAPQSPFAKDLRKRRRDVACVNEMQRHAHASGDADPQNRMAGKHHRH